MALTTAAASSTAAAEARSSVRAILGGDAGSVCGNVSRKGIARRVSEERESSELARCGPHRRGRAERQQRLSRLTRAHSQGDDRQQHRDSQRRRSDAACNPTSDPATRSLLHAASLGVRLSARGNSGTTHSSGARQRLQRYRASRFAAHSASWLHAGRDRGMAARQRVAPLLAVRTMRCAGSAHSRFEP